MPGVSNGPARYPGSSGLLSKDLVSSDGGAILPPAAIVSLPALIPGGADATPAFAMRAFETFSQKSGQTQLTADSWNSGVSGNWTMGSDWSTGSAPTSSSTATIAAAGTYIVTINSSVAANSLTINDANATLADTSGGTLAINTTLAIAAGTFSLGTGSTLSGGTVSLGSAGVFAAAGGTLNGVTYQGVLNLSTASAILYGKGNLTFEGTGGTGAGTINLTGSDAALLYSGSGTLNGATINIGSSGADYLDGTGGTLNLGTGTTLVQGGTYAYLGDEEDGETFVNQGMITAGYAGGYFGVTGPGLTNTGNIAVSNGDTFDMSSLASFTNTGTITATGTGTVISFGGAWSNSGSVLVSGGALADLGGTFSTPSLSEISVSTGGILDITGDLTNTAGTLVVGTGSALGAVELSGTITGGTIADAGNGIIADYGTLSGVAYQGVLNLSASRALLYVAGSLDVNAAGGGSGTINLTGDEAAVIYLGTATLDDVTVDLGSVNGSYLDGESGKLTLGPGASVVQTGSEAYLGDYYNAETFINQGTITAGYSGGYFGIAGPGFTNAGKIAVANGDTTSIFSTAWTNTGTITATGTGTVLSFGGIWTNSGSVSVGGNALLNLGGNFSTSSLSGATLGSGAAVEISGDLNNTGAMLVVGTGSVFGAVSLSGTITGGTIADAGGGIVANYGTLNGVTYQGVLDLSVANAVLYATGNLSFEGSGGSGAGTIDLTGNDAALIYSGSNNLNNVTIDIGSVDGSYVDGDGGTLTFGSGTNLIQAGAQASLGEIYNAETFINQGALTAGYSGGSFSISGPGFANAGSITVSNGDSLNMAQLTAFTNLKNSTLTGGSYEVDAGSTLQLLDNATIVTDAATIILSGTSSVITSLDTSSNEKIKIDQTLLTISSSGTLELLAKRNFTASAAFTDNGLLQLGGVTFTAGSGLSIGSAGSVSGYGTVRGAVADVGSITASGGTLSISGTVTGNGALGAAAGAVVDLTSAGALTQAISGAGTLELAGAGAHTLAAGATVRIADIKIDKGAILSGAGTIGGALSDAGTLAATGGTLLVEGALTGAGALTVASGAVLELTDGGSFTGNIHGAGTLQLDGGNAFFLQTSAALSIAAVLVDAGAILDLTQGCSLDSNFGGAGTLQLDGATAYELAGASIGVATLKVDSGATLSGRGGVTGSVTNAGTITASGGILQLTGAISGSGALTAAAGATVDLTAGGQLGGNISGAGTLQLDGAKAYTISASTILPISKVKLDAGATLSGSGTVQSSVADAGTVNATGGTLTLGSVTGAGAITAARGAVVDLTAGGALSEAISGAGTLQLDGSTPYTHGAAALAITALTLNSGVALSGTGSISSAIANNGTITASGGKLILSGQIAGSGALQAAASSVLDLTAGETLNQAVGGAGKLELGGAFQLGSGALSVATVAIDAGASLSGAGSLTSSINDAGTLTAAGGVLTVNGKISGGGTLSAAAGAVLNLADGGSFTGDLGGMGTVEISTALSLDQGAAFSAATTEETANVSLDANTALSLAAGAALDMTAASSATVALQGPSTSSFTNNGNIVGNGAGTAELNVAVINNANVSVGSGTLSFLSTLTNNGTIDASAGLLSVKDTVGGTGILQIGATGTISLLLGAGTGQSVDFLASSGLLDLTKPIDFTGMITGFAGSDVIDLLKAPATSYGFSNNVLTIDNGTTTEASLHFSSGYSLADFSISSDMNGGTFIKFV